MTIIAVGGRIASGKTLVSRAIAAHLGASWVGFGDAVRAEATVRGLHLERTVLQDLGSEMIAAGWPEFCERVVRVSHWDGAGDLIVDGTRHGGAIDALSELASPDGVFLLFVDASPARRRERLTARGVAAGDALAADGHPNEAEVDSLRGRADLVVRNDGRLADKEEHLIAICAQVLEALKWFRAR